MFDGGLFEIVRQSGLAGGGSGAGQDVTSGILNPGSAEGGVRSAEWGTERDDALTPNQIFDAGLLGPAVGFVGFEFEFGDGFNGITGRKDFGVVGIKLVGCGGGSREGAVGFFVEAGGNGFDGVGEEIVVIGDGEGEAGFDGAYCQVRGIAYIFSWTPSAELE